jgi:asparagine synthase (glutamine-hydrolysing)
MTMATSVELRVPLLDHKILEFAASLPSRYKVRGWTTKRILKDALRSSVPKEILDRKKTGFPVPYKSWLFRKDIIEYVIDSVLAQSARLGEIFDMEKVKALLESQRRTGMHAKETFCLLNLGLWNQMFNNGPIDNHFAVTGSQPTADKI